MQGLALDLCGLRPKREGEAPLKRVMGFTPQPFGSFAAHAVMSPPTL